MAFCNKLRGLLRQSISTGNALNATAAYPSMFNAIRCMSTKLFIGGLSYGTDDQSLRDAFASFGEVTEARVILDRDTGRSRGFGFVNFTDDKSAEEAISAMDGQELQGRNIRVNVAQEKTPRSGFGGGGNSGGYGGGGNSGGYGGGGNSGGYGGGYRQDRENDGY